MATTALEKLQQSLEHKNLAALIASERGVWLLADCSSSMACWAVKGSRYDILVEIVNKALAIRSFPIIAFGPCTRNPITGDESNVAVVSQLPGPSGGTPLHMAIELAIAKGAKRIVVVSDGEPDSKLAALASAKRFGKPVDVVLASGDNNGMEFMNELAAATGGHAYKEAFEKPAELERRVIGLLTE
jgi:hypothetical protein